VAGLYLTRTRAYNPKTGRFLQRDILDEKGRDGVYAGFPFGVDAIGTNLYAWCKNNPTNMVDPSGEWGFRTLIRGFANVARKFLGNPRGYISAAAGATYGAARAAGAYQSAARAAVRVAKAVQTVTKTAVVQVEGRSCLFAAESFPERHPGATAPPRHNHPVHRPHQGK